MNQPSGSFAPADFNFGSGKWVANEDVDSATNVAGRWYRGESGNHYKYGACFPRERAVAWFFPEA